MTQDLIPRTLDPVGRPVLQALQLLRDNLLAAPEGLGDARKESPEELAERHERVLAASLLALSSLLDLLVSTQPHETANGIALTPLLSTYSLANLLVGY